MVKTMETSGPEVGDEVFCGEAEDRGDFRKIIWGGTIDIPATFIFLINPRKYSSDRRTYKPSYRAESR